MSQSEVATMAEHDLSKTIIPYLDRHLAFPLLSNSPSSPSSRSPMCKPPIYELVKGTNMLDYAVSMFEQLNPDTPVLHAKLSSSLVGDRVRDMC